MRSFWVSKSLNRRKNELWLETWKLMKAFWQLFFKELVFWELSRELFGTKLSESSKKVFCELSAIFIVIFLHVQVALKEKNIQTSTIRDKHFKHLIFDFHLFNSWIQLRFMVENKFWCFNFFQMWLLFEWQHEHWKAFLLFQWMSSAEFLQTKGNTKWAKTFRMAGKKAHTKQEFFASWGKPKSGRKQITKNKLGKKTYREPPPMAATESTFDTPLTGDENISVFGANACCCDELPNIPATGWCWPCGPTAAPPPCNGNDFDGEPPKASRIESSKSSNALFGGGALKAPRAGDAFCEPFDLGGGGRAGGPAALTRPLLAFSPANKVCCAPSTSSVKNGFSSLPAGAAAACV